MGGQETVIVRQAKKLEYFVVQQDRPLLYSYWTNIYLLKGHSDGPLSSVCQTKDPDKILKRILKDAFNLHKVPSVRVPRRCQDSA